MNHKNIIFHKIKKYKAGTHIIITFKIDKPFTPFYLINLAKANTFTFADENMPQIILKIKNTSRWDILPDRIIEIITTKTFNPTLLSEDIFNSVDNIEVVKP